MCSMARSRRPNLLLLPCVALLLLASGAVCPARADVAIKAAQQSTLLLIKSFFGDSFWKADTWAAGQRCDEINIDTERSNMWIGVSCDSRGNVIRLDVHGNAVNAGVIPALIAQLPFLQTLDLSFNQFTGNIPTEFTALSKLEFLSLNNNQLSGSIPMNVISALVNLKYLGLANNNLGGSLPAGLAALNNLTTLALGGNSLSGSLPAQFSGFRSLQDLMLSSNSFSGGLASLAPIRTLHNIDLSRNLIPGAIPLSFSTLTNLRTLDLSANLLSGSIPEIFAGLNFLWSVALANNSLSGLFPTSLASLSKIQLIDVSNNGLTGYLPVFPSNSAALMGFKAAYNYFYGSPAISLSGRMTCAKLLAYTGSSIARNCLNVASLPTCSETQRTVGTCSAFCSTSTATSGKTQCGGSANVCVLSGSAATCVAPSSRR